MIVKLLKITITTTILSLFPVGFPYRRISSKHAKCRILLKSEANPTYYGEDLFQKKGCPPGVIATISSEHHVNLHINIKAVIIAWASYQLWPFQKIDIHHFHIFGLHLTVMGVPISRIGSSPNEQKSRNRQSRLFENSALWGLVDQTGSAHKLKRDF